VIPGILTDNHLPRAERRMGEKSDRHEGIIAIGEGKLHDRHF
jgi:hypothetical protein